MSSAIKKVGSLGFLIQHRLGCVLVRNYGRRGGRCEQQGSIQVGEVPVPILAAPSTAWFGGPISKTGVLTGGSLRQRAWGVLASESVGILCHLL